MKKIQIAAILCTLFFIAATAGCSTKNPNGGTALQEPEDSTAITDSTNSSDNAREPGIAIIGADNYEKLEISDWLDSDTVVASKENDSLEIMKLEELADSYPRSLYLYNLSTKEYTLLAEEKNLNLGGAKLSPDKKNLLYYGNSLGDPSYYVFNLESMKSFPIAGEGFGNVGSALWADNDTVIGAGYMGGAYYAGIDGQGTPIEELSQKAIYIIKKLKDTIYYNTTADGTLMALNSSTGESISLGLTDVSGLYPAPDEKQLLVLQYSGSKQLLLLCGKDGSNPKTIAEGVELGGVSWSPDQRLIAYSLQENENDTTDGDLYIYDSLTGTATQVAANISNAVTCWSPSGEKLAYTQWDGKQYNSSVVSLTYLKE